LSCGCWLCSTVASNQPRCLSGHCTLMCLNLVVQTVCLAPHLGAKLFSCRTDWNFCYVTLKDLPIDSLEIKPCRYHLKDVIIGKIYFLLVRIKIKNMDLEIRRRESTGSGTNTHVETETLAKFELMDGAPVRGMFTILLEISCNLTKITRGSIWWNAAQTNTPLTNYLCDELKSLLTSVSTSQVNADLSFKWISYFYFYFYFFSNLGMFWSLSYTWVGNILVFCYSSRQWHTSMWILFQVNQFPSDCFLALMNWHRPIATLTTSSVWSIIWILFWLMKRIVATLSNRKLRYTGCRKVLNHVWYSVIVLSTEKRIDG